MTPTVGLGGNPNGLLVRALASTTPRRPRGEKKPIPDTLKDEKYYERRKRNNLAAKKSRDARKQREDQVRRAGMKGRGDVGKWEGGRETNERTGMQEGRE